MATSIRHFLPLLAALPIPLASAAPAESPPVDARRFPNLVHLLLVPEEAAVLKELRDDKDKREFQKIFWARRDPTPGSPVNEFENNVRAVWKHADDLFSYPNRKGSETGCGQVLALLGLPEEVLGKGDEPRTPSTAFSGRGGQELPPASGAGRMFDNTAYLREGSAREAETWVYRDRPGLPYNFTGAEVRIAFDPECNFAEGGIVIDDLRRAAASLVTRPDLGYARGSDGHLLPLAAAAPASAAGGGARGLLAAPRSDFPLAAEAKILMRAPKGEAFVGGLVKAVPGAAASPGPLSIAAEAVDAAGQAAASTSREAAARSEADGSVLASWGLSLKPGHYKVTVAALLPGPGKGSASSIDVDVPDFGRGALVASPLVVYPDEPPAPGGADPRDPYAALQLGPLRLHPRFGNVFAPRDALMVVAALYGAKVDPATGQAGLRSRYSVLKDGKPVARGGEDAFTTPDAVASVGPIPLADYPPGAYVVRLDVTDRVANQTLRQEASFEIRKP
ncbi:MAG TPA: GWxTD domain-containing protein [Vicinamibacteria bacterium]|nr:GWxTD domain-containing protein [Vicinamibacteria bacterium]